MMAAAAFLVGCTSDPSNGQSADSAPVASVDSRDWAGYEKPSEADLRARLSPLEFDVTQRNGTERAFTGPYWDAKEHGVSVDIVSGEPLFSSLDKFKSGTGWPSFTRPLPGVEIVEVKDGTHGMSRVEVRSKHADSHLGHVFTDGPEPTGLRYCINGSSLRFVPVEELSAKGYGALLQPFVEKGLAVAPPTRERAILAGGCFWGMEDLIRKIPGVLETDVGYSGGAVDDATYKDVKTGASGHAEAVEVVFDPAVLSYEHLLLWYFRMHDPTTRDRQGNDRGSQYRSAIFYTSDAQRDTAQRVKAAVEAAGHYPSPIVTEITQAGPFWKAEASHQDYLAKNPNGYTCHFLRDWGSDWLQLEPAPKQE
jgi:peptide methionine sulfoxide reductase msrA/msrB